MSAIRQPIDDMFAPGQTVLESGIYAFQHRPGCGAAAEIVLIAGETFPSCNVCGAGAHFRLLHAAPHIRQDADFCE